MWGVPECPLTRTVSTLSQLCSGRIVWQFGQSHEVVPSYRQLRPHLVAVHSPVPQLMTASDSLHPAEHLLSSPTDTLREPACAMLCGSAHLPPSRVSSLSRVRCSFLTCSPAGSPQRKGWGRKDAIPSAPSAMVEPSQRFEPTPAEAVGRRQSQPTLISCQGRTVTMRANEQYVYAVESSPASSPHWFWCVPTEVCRRSMSAPCATR